MSRAKTTSEKYHEQILKLEFEKQMRCGDGTGNTFITSHSTNCKCKEIDEELDRLQLERNNLVK